MTESYSWALDIPGRTLGERRELGSATEVPGAREKTFGEVEEEEREGERARALARNQSFILAPRFRSQKRSETSRDVLCRCTPDAQQLSWAVFLRSERRRDSTYG
ncbi:uncharacterized [Tachysurus ichikawai]